MGFHSLFLYLLLSERDSYLSIKADYQWSESGGELRSRTNLAMQPFKVFLACLKIYLHPHHPDPLVMDNANLLNDGFEGKV